MKQLITLLLCCGFSTALLSQKYDYVWMAGAYFPSDSTSSNFTIDFKSFPPIVEKIPDSLSMAMTGVAISDASGLLQFYTNGCIVRAKNHTTMQGGEFINEGPGNNAWLSLCGVAPIFGSYGVFQGIFAMPFENGIQELFHTRFEFVPPAPSTYCTHDALLYSRININANQGLGKVVFKDSVLVEGCLQTACANRHANGRDWWVLLPDNVNNRFYRFLSTPEGLQGPWVQEIENPTIVDTFYYVGWSEFSPNGERLLINDIQTGTAIYDFDRCTGLLSNLKFIPAEGDGYGYAAAFSPDNKMIYVVKDYLKKIEQFDLEAVDIVGSRTLIATWDGYTDYFEPNGPFIQTFFGFFQHGPDGKLYNWAGGSRFMHVMDFPNRKGMDCKFRQRAMRLPNYVSADAYYPNYRLGPIDGSLCDTLGIDNHPAALFRYDLEDSTLSLQVTFTDLSYYEPDNWLWDFGDGSVSQDTSPVHSFPAPGLYQVCLTVSNQYGSDTLCQEVMVGIMGVSTHGASVQGRLMISPNPATDALNIRFEQPLAKVLHLRVLDLRGQVVRTTTLGLGIETYTLVLAGLGTGMYFVEFQSPSMGISVQKFLIAR